MSITFNPMQTSTFSGGFYPKGQDGLIQGEVVQMANLREFIAGGVVASTVTGPVYGGMGIAAATEPAGIDQGAVITVASTVATILGFTISTSMHNAIVTPGVNSAPSVSAGMSVQYALLGSRIQLAVSCSSALAALQSGTSPLNAQVSWDPVAQQLIPFVSGTNTALSVQVLKINVGNSKTISLVGGVPTWTNTGTAAIIIL